MTHSELKSWRYCADNLWQSTEMNWVSSKDRLSGLHDFHGRQHAVPLDAGRTVSSGWESYVRISEEGAAIRVTALRQRGSNDRLARVISSRYIAVATSVLLTTASAIAWASGLTAFVVPAFIFGAIAIGAVLGARQAD